MKNITLTQENLQAIYEAMQVIKENDRSDYFKNYYTEVVERLLEEMTLNDQRRLEWLTEREESNNFSDLEQLELNYLQNFSRTKNNTIKK